MPQATTTATTDRSLYRSGAPRAGTQRRPRSRATSVRRPKALAASRRPGPQQLGVSGIQAVLPPLFDDEHGENSFLIRLATNGWRAESSAVALTEVYCFADWLAHHADAADSTARHPRHVREATARTITDYRDHLLAAGLSVSTTRLALVCLRLYYDFITGTHRSLANPARHIPLPTRDLPDATPYTEAEVAAIFATLTDATWQAWETGNTSAWLELERDHAMLRLLYHCGLRRGEIRRLRVRDIDLAAAEIRIRGKGEKPRTVTIPQTLVAELRRYLQLVRCAERRYDFAFCELEPATGNWVNAGSDADRNATRYRTAELADKARDEDPDYGLAPDTLTSRVHLHGRRAGIDGPHYAHRWRHTFASRCAEAGMTMEDIARFLGHSISSRQNGVGWNPITLDYIHLTDQHLHRVVNEALPDPLAPAGQRLPR